MTEDISSILCELKMGQVIKVDQNEYVFIEPRKKRAVVCKRGEKDEFILKGQVEITDEIDVPTLERLEDEAIELLLKEQQVYNMKRNQFFIGMDDREYYLLKRNRYGISCIDKETGLKKSVKVSFVKKILEKIYSKD